MLIRSEMWKEFARKVILYLRSLEFITFSVQGIYARAA